MKNLFIGIVICALAHAPLAAIGESAEEDWCYDMAKEFAGYVGALACDDAYIQSLSNGGFECMEALKDADFGSVADAYRIAISEDALSQMDEWTSGDQMTDVGREAIRMRLPSVFLSEWNATAGAECLAASAILTYSRTYEMPDEFEMCVWILKLEGAAVGVGFAQTGENTVTVSACPLFMREGSTIEDAVEWISNFQGQVAAEQAL